MRLVSGMIARKALVSLVLPSLLLAGVKTRILFDSTPDVPFYGQTERGCGAAALAMVMGFWARHGAKIDPIASNPQTIESALYDRAVKGIRGDSLVKYANEHGFDAHAISAELARILAPLQMGQPVIACIKPAGMRGRALHYVVLVGYQQSGGYLVVHDSAKGPGISMQLPDFERQWKASGHWMMIATPR
jgi:ABC-type bacteriocin/lantibiotic exporter with double-glycine peptidase domain